MGQPRQHCHRGGQFKDCQVGHPRAVVSCFIIYGFMALVNNSDLPNCCVSQLILETVLVLLNLVGLSHDFSTDAFERRVETQLEPN